MRKKCFIIMLVLVLLLAAKVSLAAPATLTQSVTYNSETITMRLTRDDLRGGLFELWQQNSSGGYDAVTAVAERSYIGTVDEYPDAISCGILKDDGTTFLGAVYFDRGASWFTSGSSVVATRGLEYSDYTNYQYPLKEAVGPNQSGSTMYGFDVGIDAEYDFYTAAGSTAAALEQIEYSFCLVRALYMKDLLLKPYLGRVIVRTSQAHDPYVGLTEGDYLNAVKAEWNTNHTDANSDLVAGLTPNKMGGGLAFSSTVGTTNGYSINQSVDNGINGKYDVTWRHEMGHNWGLGHYVGGSPEGKGIMGGNSPARFTGCEARVVFEFRDSLSAGIIDALGTYTDINLPPYATLDSATTVQGAASIVFDPLANDYDANADTLTLQSYDLVSNLGVPVTLSAGTGSGGRDELIYGPATKLGTDFIRYKIVDSSGQTATGVIVVEVTLPFAEYEAEDAVYSGPTLETDQSGYSGTGYLDYTNASNDYIEWTIDVPSDGFYTLAFRYGLGAETSRPLEVKVDGQISNSALDFPGTGAWNTWKYTEMFVELTAGVHTIRTTAIGFSGGNLDLLRVYNGMAVLDIDAYVRGGGYGDDNFGDDEALEVKNEGVNHSYTRESYLRFNYSDITQPIQSANLILTPASIQTGGDATKFTVTLIDDTDDVWSEDEITYNNRPIGAGAAVTFIKGGLAVGVPYSINVTNLLAQAINNNKVASFQIVNNAAYHVTFHSQESPTAAYRPELEIVTYLPGDINLDGDVNFEDFTLLAQHWMDMNCSDATVCGRSDIDQDNDVDIDDLKDLAEDWLK